MKALLFVVALLLSCCHSARALAPAPERHPIFQYQEILIDDAFDAPDQGAILGAVAQWDHTFNGLVQLRPRVAHLTLLEDAILVMRVDSACSFIPHVPPESGDVLAWVDQRGGRKVWIIRDRIGAWQMRPVVMHELGHVFGAPDRTTPGLMRGVFTPLEYTCVDKMTADVVATWTGLPGGSLAACP